MRLALLLGATAGALLAASPIVVHGHRGARAARPENTIPAFEYAIREGVDVLELDVAVTRDDVLVVSHDPRLNPAICTSPGGSRVIHEVTLAELKQWDCGTLKNPGFANQQSAPGARVPTLDEVLALAPRGKFGFNIETKIFPKEPQLTPPPERFAEMMLAALRKHKVESRTIVQSFDFRTLVAMRKLDPKIRLAALFSNTQEDFVAITRRAQADYASPHFSLVTPEKVKAAHDAGVEVVAWTPNKPEDWRKMVDAKVDAIITDDPAGLIAWLKSKGLR
jgi:glycerophosphoryl diester phosphodiesterase